MGRWKGAQGRNRKYGGSRDKGNGILLTCNLMEVCSQHLTQKLVGSAGGDPLLIFFLFDNPVCSAVFPHGYILVLVMEICGRKHTVTNCLLQTGYGFKVI